MASLLRWRASLPRLFPHAPLRPPAPIATASVCRQASGPSPRPKRTSWVPFLGLEPSAATLYTTATTFGKFILVPYVGLLLLMVTFQRQIIYPRPSEVADPAATGGAVYLLPGTAATGKVPVVHFPSTDPAAPTLVYLHGNADQLGWGAAYLGPVFQQHGCAFYGVEYPGYGLARGSGAPSEAALCSAAEYAVAHLTAPAPAGLGVPPAQVVLFGQSIGSGVAMALASRGIGAKVVLLSPFTSVPQMAQSALPLLRVVPLAVLNAALGDHFDNEAKAPSVDAPVCIIHGDSDEIVPFRMGRRLHELLPRSEFHPLRHAGHNDVFLSEGDRVVRTVAAFATATQPPRPLKANT